MATHKWLLTPPNGVAIRQAATPGARPVGISISPISLEIEFNVTERDKVLDWLETFLLQHRNPDNNPDSTFWAEQARQALNQTQPVNPRISEAPPAIPGEPPELAVMRVANQPVSEMPPEVRLSSQSAAYRTQQQLAQQHAQQPIPDFGEAEPPPGYPQSTAQTPYEHAPVQPPAPSRASKQPNVSSIGMSPEAPKAAKEFNPLTDGCPRCSGPLDVTPFNGMLAIKCKTPGCPGLQFSA